MAVSKRTRFEVLRRDDFQCQYCGLKATETGDGLTIDHVVPVSLGGSDKPENLVAACKDCNAGKSSIQPDAPLVAEVSSSAIDWALARSNRNALIDADLRDSEEYEEEFYSTWNGYEYHKGITAHTVPLPNDWRQALNRWWKMGVPKSLIDHAVTIAMAKQMENEHRFRYFAGVIWRTLDEYDSASDLQTMRGRVYGPDEVEEIAERRSIQVAHNYLDLMDRMARILSVSPVDWRAAQDLAFEERREERSQNG